MTLYPSPFLINNTKELVRNRFLILFLLLFGALGFLNAIDVRETNSITFLTPQQNQLLQNQDNSNYSFHLVSSNFEKLDALFIEPNIENEEEEEFECLKRKLQNKNVSFSFLHSEKYKHRIDLDVLNHSKSKVVLSTRPKFYLLLGSLRI